MSIPRQNNTSAVVIDDLICLWNINTMLTIGNHLRIIGKFYSPIRTEIPDCITVNPRSPSSYPSGCSVLSWSSTSLKPFTDHNHSVDFQWCVLISPVGLGLMGRLHHRLLCLLERGFCDMLEAWVHWKGHIITIGVDCPGRGGDDWQPWPCNSEWYRTT